MPTGMIVSFGGELVPAGFLLCDGSAINRSSFSALFVVIGENYGAGDGVTTFNLPNLQGKYPHGLSLIDVEFDTLGETGGQIEVTMDADQIPVHRHILRGGGSGDGNAPMNNNGPDSSDGGAVGTITPGQTDRGVTENTGIDNLTPSANNPHNNMSPFQIVNYLIQV